MSTKPEEKGVRGTPADDRIDADRRRVLGAGLAAVPLFVTLAARPAFAQGDYLGLYTSPELVQPEPETTGG